MHWWAIKWMKWLWVLTQTIIPNIKQLTMTPISILKKLSIKILRLTLKFIQLFCINKSKLPEFLCENQNEVIFLNFYNTFSSRKKKWKRSTHDYLFCLMKNSQSFLLGMCVKIQIGQNIWNWYVIIPTSCRKRINRLDCFRDVVWPSWLTWLQFPKYSIHYQLFENRHNCSFSFLSFLYSISNFIWEKSTLCRTKNDLSHQQQTFQRPLITYMVVGWYAII